MFNKKYQIIVTLFLAMLSYPIFAGSVEKECDSSDYNCHGTLYLTGGYAFDHADFSNHTYAIAPPGQSALSFTYRGTAPNNFSGFRLGFGDEFSSNKKFGYELAYNQFFTRTKTIPGLRVYTKGKVFTADLGYQCFHYNRFSGRLIAGVAIISTYSGKTTLSPNKYVNGYASSADVDPFLGAAVLYQINSSFAVKLAEFYDMSAYNDATSEHFASFLMLVYYPK